MKKILLLAALVLVFLLQGKLFFSESRVRSWVATHSALAMSGDTMACEQYADDVEVMLRAEGARGHWEVEGGKEEMCGYLRQAAAAFTVLQARTHTQFDQVVLTPARFPWMSAKVSYVQRTTVSAEHIPTMTIESRDTLELVRTFSGMKIKKIDAHSTGGL